MLDRGEGKWSTSWEGTLAGKKTSELGRGIVSAAKRPQSLPPKPGCFVTASRVMSPLHMLIIVVFLFSISTTMAFAQSNSAPGNHRPKSLDPMNRPMDELGVTGKDDTLCSDRWYSCTTYDRLQFDQKYPGQRLKDMLRFGEPEWPGQGQTSLRLWIAQERPNRPRRPYVRQTG